MTTTSRGGKLPHVSKYKKAPQAPRRFKSSYMFFSIEKHKQIRDEMTERCESKEKICTTTVAKMVSQAWKNISPDEREVFEEMARKDKERYEKEKRNYRGPWKVLDEKLRKKKDPDAPKKPMSAFLAFSNSKRSEVKKDHGGDIDNAELSRILAQMWKEASEEDRKVYIDKEFELRREYKIAMEQWKKENEESKIINESCATGERNVTNERPSSHSEHYHGSTYSKEDAPYFDQVCSSINNEERGASYGSGYYPYYHYQNGHLYQLHPGTYPSAPSSYGDTSQYHPHQPTPLPPQQQSSTIVPEANAASETGPSYYSAHTYRESLPAPIPDTNTSYHHYHYGHQHQASYSTYHQQSPPTRRNPEQAATAPYGYNQPGENSNHRCSSSDYSHGKTDYTTSGEGYGGDFYQLHSLAQKYPYYDKHQRQQYQHSENDPDVHDKNSYHTITTPNHDYYGGNRNTSYHYQGSIDYHSKESGEGPARDPRQQQGDGSHRYRFGGPYSLPNEAEHY